MADSTESKSSFWVSVPGILTAVAAFLSACTGLYLALAPKSAPVAPGPQPFGVSQQQPPTAPETQFRVVEAMLRADPFDYTGRCPITIKFTGRISTAGGQGVVSFKFLRSDSASAPVQSLTFERAESLPESG